MNINATAFRSTVQHVTTSSNCFSGDPCFYEEMAANNSVRNDAATGQEISAGTGLAGGVAGAIFIQTSSQTIGGATVSTRSTGSDLSFAGPGGSSLIAGLGITTLRTGLGTETGATVRAKVKLPVLTVGGGQISFEVGEQFTNTPTMRSSNLLFGVTGGMAGGQAASAPKEEPMQAPKLASAGPSDRK